MAAVLLTTLLVIFLGLLLRVAYDTLSCYFLTPRRIKKIMEKQGVHGPKPRPLAGNIKEMSSLVTKSTSHDMHTIDHDIVGRLLPHYVAWSKLYGLLFRFHHLYHINLISHIINQLILCILFDIWSNWFIGKRFIYWTGTEPRMCLTETELIKELLSKYSTISGKSWLQQQGSKHFIGRGLLMANGEDWYHQRHIVAPAFMGDRLKVWSWWLICYVIYCVF